MPFLQELKRRNVIRVAVLYVLATWMLLQVADVGANLLELPGWVGRFVLLVMVLGFLPMLTFAWIYELTPEGLKRTSAAPATASIRGETGRRINLMIGIVGTLALLTIAADRLMPETGITDTDMMPATSRAEDVSIAVLPFVDMSEDQDQAYFADGLSEELLNVLAKIPTLRVISRTSSFQFKGRHEDVRSIADQLGVANILEGSVRMSGNRVRITTQLVQASDGSHLWSDTFDRDLDDIFEVQDEIAGAVARQLEIELLHGTLPSPGRTDNSEAHTLYLQGRHFAGQRSGESYERAIDYYLRALEADPQYALAAAMLSIAYVDQVGFGYAPFEAGAPLAREAAARSIELDSDLADSHLALGYVNYMLDWQWEAADRAFRKALTLDPGNAVALRQAGNLAQTLGRRDESIRLYRLSLERDPLRSATYSVLALTLTDAGRYADAEDVYRKLIELQPDFPGAHFGLARLLVMDDNPARALEVIGRESDVIWRACALPMIHQALGQHEKADAALAMLIRDYADIAAFQIAEVYAFRGDTDSAFSWLERAYEQRDGGLSGVLSDGLFANLVDDPRYPVFLGKMKLPGPAAPQQTGRR